MHPFLVNRHRELIHLCHILNRRNEIAKKSIMWDIDNDTREEWHRWNNYLSGCIAWKIRMLIDSASFYKFRSSMYFQMAIDDALKAHKLPTQRKLKHDFFKIYKTILPEPLFRQCYFCHQRFKISEKDQEKFYNYYACGTDHTGEWQAALLPMTCINCYPAAAQRIGTVAQCYAIIVQIERRVKRYQGKPRPRKAVVHLGNYLDVDLKSKRNLAMEPIKDTKDLRQFLLSCMIQLAQRSITANEARAQAMLARAVLDTAKLELVSARSGTLNYQPIHLGREEGQTVPN